MKYFSYGSNMSETRIGRRISKFEVLGECRLGQHELRFHKASKDGSSKCDAYFTGIDEDFILGVLYEIDDSEKRTLDRFEGAGYGYEVKNISVELGEEKFKAVTYIATEIKQNLKPYSWYVRHVLEGAKAMCFPAFYIAMIEDTVVQPDPDQNREKRELSIYR